MNDSDHDKALKKIGEIVKTHRNKIGLSQLDLGVKVGLSANHIGRIERAETNPTIITLLQLADLFELDITDFF